MTIGDKVIILQDRKERRKGGRDSPIYFIKDIDTSPYVP